MILIFFWGTILFFPWKKAFSQTYGLGFYSYEVSKDLRTGLSLNPDKSFTFKDEFELSFSFNLRPNEVMYFGYIFRIISDDLNIDLIYNYDSPDNTYLTLVQGQKLLVKKQTDFSENCSHWSDFRFKFDIRNNQATIIFPDTTLIINGLSLKNYNKTKIFFGLCNYANFKTTDVPAMNLKDIRILENNKIVNHWPLNELSGNLASSSKGNNPGEIVNPLWLKSEHFTWKEIYNLEQEGSMQTAFDSENEEVIITGTNEISRFSVRTNNITKFIPENSNANLLPFRQAVYDTQSKLLFNIDIDKPSVSVFDFESLTWSKDLQAGLNESDFEQFNKYYSIPDSSIYLFGGYGHYRYKNQVLKLNVINDKTKILKPTGDFFSPRYLSALGELNDTIYLLGGFGSNSGEQILSPHSYYDLIAFSLKDYSFHKIFELASPPDALAFSNSMIINPEDRSYYVLAFPVFKYNGYLQLIKGSLDSPEYSLMGNQIPYQFLDIVSFADLFYCKQNKKIVAVSVHNDKGKSRIRIYSLGFPPDYQTVINSDKKNQNLDIKTLIFVLTGSVIIAGLLIFYIFRRKKKKYNDKLGQVSTTISDVYDTQIKDKNCSINFFGDFQVINTSGVDITRKFTPLLKELFLLIWLNSVKNDIGVSNEKIIETLWPGFSEGSAHNNKAVNIAKLRAILTEECCCELSYKTTGYWKVDYKNNHIDNDYFEFIKIVNKGTDLSKSEILKLIEFSHKGSFLSNLKYEWLDEYKSTVSNEIISRLIKYGTHLNIKDQPEFVIQIADSIANFDAVNEEAMEINCKALIALGRHTAAKEVYDKFYREYKILYSSEYEKSFSEIATL